MRHIGPKNKASRREKFDLGLKTTGSKAQATLLRKLNIGPGQHGGKRKRKSSERARQLREKQKLRYMFGISEGQLNNYFKKAVTMPGNTGSNLAQLLERRLDNVVFRAGFAPTRASARQLVNHGHVQVNEKRMSIASYAVLKGDKVMFRKPATAEIPYIKQQIDNKSTIIPEWVKITNTVAEVAVLPTSDEIEKQVDLRPVIEYYSR